MKPTLHRFAFAANLSYAVQFANAMLKLDWDVPYIADVSHDALEPTDEPLGDVSIRGNIEGVQSYLNNRDPSPPEDSPNLDHYLRWHAGRIEYLSIACGALAVLRERFGSEASFPDVSSIIGDVEPVDDEDTGEQPAEPAEPAGEVATPVEPVEPEPTAEVTEPSETAEVAEVTPEPIAEVVEPEQAPEPEVGKPEPEPAFDATPEQVASQPFDPEPEVGEPEPEQAPEQAPEQST